MKLRIAAEKLSLAFLSILIGLTVSSAAVAQGKIAFTSNRDGNEEIYVMNADGTNQVRLTSDTADDFLPSFSTGGAKIVFYSNRDGLFEIYVMNSNGTDQTRLTNNSAVDFDPSFSPDGSKITFASNRDGNFEVYVMNSDGSNQTRLTNNTAGDFQPSFSPDGSKIVFVSDFEIYVMNSDGSNQIRLTVSPGIDIEPAFAPDGSKIVFTSNRDPSNEIYVMNSDGSNPVRLTENAAVDGEPVFSPDGSKIAFYTNRDGNNEIYVMNAEGGSPQRLTSNTSNEFQPAWTDATLFPPELSNVTVTPQISEGEIATLSGSMFSPDGSQSLSLTVNWGDGSPEQAFNYPAGTTSFVETHQYLDNLFDIPYIVNLTLTTANGSDSETAVVEVNNVVPTLSASNPLPVVVGTPLTLTGTISDPGTLDTQTVNINWGDGSPNTNLNVAAGVTNFSANHTYAALGAFPINITASDDDGGNATPVNIIAGVAPPPTSGKIAFTSNFGGNNNIWLMNSNGTNQVPLTTNPASDSYPNHSRDGSKIVFQSDRDGNAEIYTMNAAGAFQTRLTIDPGQDTEPVFSPDGSLIVFATNRHGTYEIYIMNSNGTGQQRLTTNSLDDGQAEFSPDGTKIIFSRLAANQSDAHIYTMNLDGTGQTPLTSGSFVLNGQPSFSPDGQLVVFSSVRPFSGHTDPEIYVMDANGANQLRRTMAAGQDMEPVFSPDGAKIAFRSERDGNAEIYIMDADGTDQQRLTFDGAGVANFAPSWSDVSIINVDIPDDIATVQNGLVIVPVTVTNTTGKGVLSYDFAVEYDPTLLQPLALPFDKVGTLSASFEVNAGASTPGRLVVSAFGTAPLVGAGTLLNLRFTAIGAAPAFAVLEFDSFVFNEGIPFAEFTAGQVFIGGSIAGRVTYGTSVAVVGVPGVSIQAAGSPNASTNSNADGTYSLVGFGPGAYVVTPSKTGDFNGLIITALDASLISQYLVGAATLTLNQQNAAEASGNGSVTSFDAALIAQYAISLPNTANVGTWRFVPPSFSYATVGTLTGQDYTAILVGDVSGNWLPSGQSAQALTLSAETTKLRESAAASRGGGRSTLEVSIGSLRATPGQSLTVPVELKFPAGTPAIRAYQFDVVFDPGVLAPQGTGVDNTATLSGGFSAITNTSNSGRLRIAVFGTGSIATGGTMINLKFTVVGARGSSSPLTFAGLLLNEGNPTPTAKNGSVTVRR
jgi:Tol biopolymer transport system component